MNEDERKLIAESTAEMRELKGEMRVFKEFVLERIRRLEDRSEGARRDRLTMAGLVISASILTLNVFMAFART